MGDYKYLLQTQLTWSYLFELVKFAWKPVVLWPLKLAYSIGFFDFGPNTVHVMFPVDIFVVYGMGVSLALCLFYRVSKIFDHSFLDIFFKNKRRIAATYLIVYAAASGLSAGLVIAEGHDVATIKSAITYDVPAAAFFFNKFSTTGGYSTKLTGLPMTIFIASTAVTVVGIVVFFVLIHYLIQAQFRKYMRCLR
ncbi:hypothetical protein AAVH_37224 [Aphelenchoides avenae]|nr:hypothetical protein AAVH_37224 [Aphelenchus avenae]